MVHSLARRTGTVTVWALWGEDYMGSKYKRPARAHIGIRSPYLIRKVARRSFAPLLAQLTGTVRGTGKMECLL